MHHVTLVAVCGAPPRSRSPTDAHPQCRDFEWRLHVHLEVGHRVVGRAAHACQAYGCVGKSRAAMPDLHGEIMMLRELVCMLTDGPTEATYSVRKKDHCAA